MPVLDPIHPVQSAILETLAAKQALTINDLHAEVSAGGVPLSKPNLYRAVSQLIDAQVLVRNAGTISLNLLWIAQVHGFWDTICATYLSESPGEFSFILKEGERREFYSDSLLNLDPIWSHVLANMTKTKQKHPTFIYNSHPWYSLGMRETETRVYKGLTASGHVCALCYGNDTFLDRYGDKLIRVKNFHTHILPELSFPKEGYALWVSDDHVLECVFPPVISRHFAFFFNTVHAIEQFDPELFTDIFRMKSKCKVAVRRNAKEAEKLRGIFERTLATTKV